MLYILKLYSAVCQLYLNKTERRKQMRYKNIFDYFSVKKLQHILLGYQILTLSVFFELFPTSLWIASNW